MKTLVIAINSKYIHSSLAPWYLKAVCGDKLGEIKVLEFTINDSIDSILAAIYLERADIAAFSCYIWNIGYVLRIAGNLKKIQKNIRIVLGGPEVSFDARHIMESNPAVDYIISGEGEYAFQGLLRFIYGETPGLERLRGVAFREGEEVRVNDACGLIENLDDIPSPYTMEMLAGLENRIVYFESSRGCPFSCSYCISSTFEGVRYFSLERVKSDLEKLVWSGVRQIKFVDRTFNCNRQRAKEIFKFIINNRFTNNFHFEAAADLFDDEMLEILSGAPEGIIQFEIGIQSTNPRTLELVNRRTSLESVFSNVKKLKNFSNIHLHLDLIAGLPAEDFSSFTRSFNDVHGLKPDQLQLGFLKLLKGSRMREEAEGYGYNYRSYPPYEVLNNRWMAYDEILLLKDVEEMVERYYNSARFVHTLHTVTDEFFESAYGFYDKLSRYFRQKGYFEKPLPARELYTALFDFLKTTVPPEFFPAVNELLKLDFLCSDNTNNLPSGIERNVEKNFNDRCFAFLKDKANIKRFLPQFEGEQPKQIFKRVHFEVFRMDLFEKTGRMDFKNTKTVVLFNYMSRDKVTGLYEFQKIDIPF